MKQRLFSWRKKAARFFNSIQSRIFLAYGSIFLFLILLSAGVYYSTAYQNFLETQQRTSRQLSKLVSEEISQYLDSVNDIQKRILESEDILTYIFEDAQKHDVLLDRAFRQNIYRITGYDFDFYHINIYNLEDQTLLTFGQSYTYQDYMAEDTVTERLIKPALEANGAIYLTALEDPALYTPVSDVSTLSLLRAFGRYSLTAPKAVIEIQVSFDRIKKLISDTVLSYGDETGQVIICNPQQKLLYPETLPAEELHYYTGLDTDNDFLFRHPDTQKTELVTAYRSQPFGITALILTPEEYLAANQRFFQKVGFCIFGVSLLLLSVLTFKIAKSISAPLTALKDRISALELTNISDENEIPVTSEGFSEVEVLNKAYNRMEARLKKSLDDIVASRTLTMHAQLMSLQAQMDSHFLYNTLTVISIIAEENEDSEAALMCMKLTEMLRYTTEDYTRETSFLMELHHCQNYSDLMSVRFGSKISFLYETEEALLPVFVPRLILQPLVENCVKYSRREGRILRISVRGFLEDGWWKLIIRDNGDGFSRDSLQQIHERIDRLNQEKEHPTMSIGGLGLANIYLRLKLYYNNQFLFQLENDPENTIYPGIMITIGGPCHEH